MVCVMSIPSRHDDQRASAGEFRPVSGFRSVPPSPFLFLHGMKYARSPVVQKSSSTSMRYLATPSDVVDREAVGYQ